MNHNLRNHISVKVNCDVIGVWKHTLQSWDIFELSQVIHKADDPVHSSRGFEEEKVFGEV